MRWIMTIRIMMSIKLNLEAVLGLNRMGTNKGAFLIIERQTMSKITFTMKNEAGEDVLYSSKEITTRDYRDYLVLNDSLTSDKTEVEKLDQQLGFIASLFENVTVEQLLEHTDFAKIIEVFTEIYAHLVGDVDPKGKK
nr:MAG TPA: hypothetical protein [Caudoviricetes sp.]DAP94318.1 MAG TPA: hypothetical protein [Caudoviricetes sp.]